MSDTKNKLRTQLRKARAAHVAALPDAVSALVFRRPPAPIMEIVPEGTAIGLYHATESEAPVSGYAKFFLEAGHTIALPRIRKNGAMAFHVHTDPFGKADLEEGPHGIMQPAEAAPQITPQVLFVPLVGFTQGGHRLGQGGGYYDRWLASHPGTIAIGLAWDVQEVDELPLEDHDMPLTAIVTTTRVYGPFA